MTKERKAQMLTVLLLGAALAFAAYKKGALPSMDFRQMAQANTKADPTPQDVIYAMLDAARDGNVQAYLAAHTGQMEQALQKAVAEQSEPAFSRYLKETNASVKGVALQEPQMLTEREVKVRVEYVYQDRNEAQSMYLEKTNGKWKIARVDSSERIPTLVPYGTPVR